MIIHRWQAQTLPTIQQMKILFEQEGLDPIEESYEPHIKISEHKHPFCEIRMVLQGEMIFNVKGNQFVLRPGDRVEIPANTKHSHTAHGSQSCICICGQRAI